MECFRFENGVICMTVFYFYIRVSKNMSVLNGNRCVESYVGEYFIHVYDVYYLGVCAGIKSSHLRIFVYFLFFR